MTILTFDLETTTAVHNKRTASPFLDSNYIVAAGFQRDHHDPFGDYFASQELSKQNYRIPFEDSDTLLVGQNIKFDLLWSWDRPELKAFLKRGGKIWDCQLAEYLLEGQQQSAHYASMDSMVQKYGGTLKIDAVKELWNEGVDTPDIPEDLLMDYLLGNQDEGIDGDVRNTYTIYTQQVMRATAIHPNFLRMLELRMDGLLATTEMEYNGIYIDRDRGEIDRELLSVERDNLTRELEEYIPDLPEGLTFNWNSVYHKSYLIYGGTASYSRWVQHSDPESPDGKAYAKKTERWPLVAGLPQDPATGTVDADGLFVSSNPNTYMVVQDTFKSGKQAGVGKTKAVQVYDYSKPKGAQQKATFRFKGYTKPEPKWESSLEDADGKPIYSTSSDIIEYLAETRTTVPFLTAMGRRQKAQKILGTYYWDIAKGDKKTGLLTLVGDDGIVHHKLNHTATVTGRLSSSDPNATNIPRGDTSDVKRMFASRHAHGRVAEVDYSQLEVVVMGMLSKDKQLTEDLQNQIDFHCKRVAAKLDMPYDEVVRLKNAKDPRINQERTNCKEFSFQRAYGAGVPAIAESTGMSEEEVQALVDAEERMYPGVEELHKKVELSINHTAQTTEHVVTVDGQQFWLQTGNWFSPCGTRFVWKEGKVPEFLHKQGKYVGFSPTEKKNYPAQGIGGFVVQMIIGKLFRFLLQHDNFNGDCLMTNTVHDSAWFDFTSVKAAKEILPQIQTIMESVPRCYQQEFNLRVNVPFPCEAELGWNLLDKELL